MAQSTVQAAWALNDPEGRWASALAAVSAMTCSMIAWPRCWDLAWRIWNGLVGEHGVVAPEVEQPVLAGRGLGVEAFDPSHDQPAGGLVVVGAGGERGKGISASAASETSSPVWSSTKACG
jgi:hypothetical protein